MQQYHLYCISNGQVFRCEEIEAPDDMAAIEEALDLRGPTAAELWSGDHIVQSFVQERDFVVGGDGLEPPTLSV